MQVAHTIRIRESPVRLRVKKERERDVDPPIFFFETDELGKAFGEMFSPIRWLAFFHLEL